MKVDLAKFGISAELPPVFDHSFTGSYIECQRMAYYERVLGRRGRETSYTLTWGAVFHALTEVWTATRDLNKCLEIISVNIPEDTDDRYGRNQRRMQEAFLEWLKYRNNDPIEVLHTEQPVTIACIGDHPCPYSDHSCDLVYGGRLDEIVRWNALVGPLDFKTTVVEENDPIAQYKPSHQMLGYTWMASHLLGKHCWGAIVERMIINKSKIKPGRFPVPFNRDQIVEWVENERAVHAEIRQKFAHCRDDESYWRQNYARCWLPYPCAFRDACLAPRTAEFRYRWIRDNTTEHRFNFQEGRKETDSDAS